MIGTGTDTNWRRQNAEWLALNLEWLALRLNRRALWLRRPQSGGMRAADWLVTAQGATLECQFYQQAPDVMPLDAAIAAVEARIVAAETGMASAPPALRSLADLVGLSAFELDILLLAAAPCIDAAFACAYAEMHDDPRRSYASLHLALGLFVEETADRVIAADCLAPVCPLRALHLLELDEGSEEPLVVRRLSIDERITDFLRGINRIDARLAPFLGSVPTALTSAATNGVAAKLAAAIAAKPDEWATVNLIGSSAAGARDLAEQACATLAMGLRAFDVSRLATCPAAERALILGLLARDALLGRFAVLVDASMVDRGSAAAGLIDEMIRGLSATVFIASPERWPTEADVQVFSVARPTRAEQRGLWQAALNGHAHAVNGEIDAIVQQFDLPASAIAAVVARAGRRNGHDITGKDLWRSCREQNGAALDDFARRIEPCYGWDDIVVNDEVRAQLRELASQVKQRGRVYETWGFGERLGRGRGITALFAGASGTGKTMAAEILAAELDLDLYRVDLAGVVSKYVGETEKNLRRVFNAAESSGAILFFDEADALFGSRTEVRSSHDRYANVEVNYLLQRMEDYTGLAILATNRRAALDPAFLRRLRFVIEFPFPGAAERRRIWEQVFPASTEREGVEYAFLSRLELSGGNIRSTAVNAAFLAAAEQVPIGMRHLVRAAAREYAKLSKPISTAEFGAYHAMVRS